MQFTRYHLEEKKAKENRRDTDLSTDYLVVQGISISSRPPWRCKAKLMFYSTILIANWLLSLWLWIFFSFPIIHTINFWIIRCLLNMHDRFKQIIPFTQRLLQQENKLIIFRFCSNHLFTFNKFLVKMFEPN